MTPSPQPWVHVRGRPRVRAPHRKGARGRSAGVGRGPGSGRARPGHHCSLRRLRAREYLDGGAHALGARAAGGGEAPEKEPPPPRPPKKGVGRPRKLLHSPLAFRIGHVCTGGLLQSVLFFKKNPIVIGSLSGGWFAILFRVVKVYILHLFYR